MIQRPPTVALLGWCIFAAPVFEARAQVQSLPQAELTFPSGQSKVEIPFQESHGLIVIPVGVNDAGPFQFILDTGSPIMVLPDAETASKLDLQVFTQTAVAGAGDGPQLTASLASGVRAETGGLKISNGVLLFGLDGVPFRGFEGVIGGPLFQNAVVEIDWGAHIVRVHRPDSFRYDGPGSIVPLKVQADMHPYIKGQVSTEGGRWVPVDLHLDCGASGALQLSVKHHADLQMPDGTLPTIVAWGVQGRADGRAGRTQKLKLGEHVLTDVVTTFADLSQDVPGFVRHGVVGVRVLKRFRVFIDYPNERLILEKSSRLGDPFRFSTTGLHLQPWASGAKSLTVAEVMPQSPSQKAGIQAGDTISAFGSRSVGDMSTGEIRELLMSPPGTTIRVRLEREGKSLERKLSTRKLL